MRCVYFDLRDSFSAVILRFYERRGCLAKIDNLYIILLRNYKEDIFIWFDFVVQSALAACEPAHLRSFYGRWAAWQRRPFPPWAYAALRTSFPRKKRVWIQCVWVQIARDTNREMNVNASQRKRIANIHTHTCTRTYTINWRIRRRHTSINML